MKRPKKVVRRGWTARTGMGSRLLALFGAAVLVGCATTPRSGPTSDRQLGLDKPQEPTQQSLRYVARRSREHRLPENYVSEARIGLAGVESRRDTASATEIERDAFYNDKMAHIMARRTAAQSDEQVALAEAQKLKRRYLAEHRLHAAELAARERSAKSNVESNMTLRSAWAKERASIQTDMVSQAEHDFTQAQARLEQLRALRHATENDGRASIDEMIENARATRSRAGATVAALRTESQSVIEQTKARMNELTQRIETVKQQSAANSVRLVANAGATEKTGIARFNELEARAQTLLTQASQEKYELKVALAKSERQKSQARFERNIAGAQSLHEQSLAEIDRLRGDANVTISNADSGFAQQLGKLDAWLKDSSADVSKVIATADRVEQNARAEFVKAEAEARANALRETAAHQDAAAEAQFKTLIAQAESEAARLREQIMSELSRKTQGGSVEFQGKTNLPAERPAGLHDVPQSPIVTEIPARLEPEHVAAFRASLAQVMRERSRATAQQSVLNATYSEQKKKLEAAKQQNLALAAEQHATSDALQKKADAELTENTAQIDAVLAIAKSTYNRSIVEASAYRKEAIAQAADLRANGKEARDSSMAQAVALRKEADVVTNSSKAEVEALVAEVKATQERGQAESARLASEATSIEKSETALAAHIDSQIESAGQTIEAELAKLDRHITSSETISKANYEQALVQAEVLGRITDVEMTRMQAEDELRQSLASAGIERTRDELYATQVKAEAQIERIIARAQADREQTIAQSEADEVSVQSRADIATANAVADRATALARETAVKALFDARIAQVNSERILASASDFLDDSFRRRNTQTALSQARAAREYTRVRLTTLAEEQVKLQRAALEDWDARLAKHRDRSYRPVNNPTPPTNIKAEPTLRGSGIDR